MSHASNKLHLCNVIIYFMMVPCPLCLLHTNDTSHTLARIVTSSSWSKAFWVRASSWALGPRPFNSSSWSLDTSSADWTLSCSTIKKRFLLTLKPVTICFLQLIIRNSFKWVFLLLPTLSICSWASSTERDWSSLSHPHNRVNTIWRGKNKWIIKHIIGWWITASYSIVG